MTTRAFVRTNPTYEPIASGLPVIRPQSGQVPMDGVRPIPSLSWMRRHLSGDQLD
jgi:hypothetical protein